MIRSKGVLFYINFNRYLENVSFVVILYMAVHAFKLVTDDAMHESLNSNLLSFTAL